MAVRRFVLRHARVAAVCVGMLALVVRPSRAQELKYIHTTPDGTEIFEIIGVQEAILDVVPIAVVYEPPGQDGAQNLVLTSSFQTKTTMTSMHTKDTTTTVGVSLDFEGKSASGSGSGSGSVDESWSYSQEDSSWHTTINSLGWTTSAHNFPGGGDLIVFYKRPKFRFTFDLGIMFQYRDGTNKTLLSAQPRLIKTEPVKEPPTTNPADQTWVRVVEALADIRTSNGAEIGGPAVVPELLRLDPFSGLRLRPFPVPVLGRPAADTSDVLATVLADPGRFAQNGDPLQWQACDGGEQVTVTQQSGHSTSNTQTYSHVAKTSFAGSLKVPIGSGLTVTPSISQDTSFTFSYTQNDYTESVYSTASTSTVGGGPASCANAPWSMTYYFFDNTFGALLFPTEALPPANTSGTAMTAQGQPASRQVVVAESSKARRFRTRTDSQGRFQLSLLPGRYSVEVVDPRGARLSQRVAFDVPAQQGSTVKLQPLKLQAP
jgi:hypothetical protein